jgi:hypothetical protein
MEHSHCHSGLPGTSAHSHNWLVLEVVEVEEKRIRRAPRLLVGVGVEGRHLVGDSPQGYKAGYMLGTGVHLRAV